MRITTGIAKRYAGLVLTALLSIPCKPAFPSPSPDSAAAAAVREIGVQPVSAEPDPLSFSFRKAAGPGAAPYIPLHALEAPIRLKLDFSAVHRDNSAQGVPSFLNQRGEYSGNGFGLSAEMGDIRIGGTANTLQEVTRKGGRFALSSGSSGNAVRMETFAASGAHGAGRDGLLVGASGELSLLKERARFKTVYVSGREALSARPKPGSFAEKKGDVLGVVAVLEPFKGKLAAEAEADFALFDHNTEDDSAAVSDSAYRFKVGGALGPCRYSAQYERTGPQYRLLGGRGPKRDWAGAALGLETDFRLHGFDVKLSRYHDNTGNNDLYPRLYRYEGVADYRFKGIRALPLALQYRKTLVDSAAEPVGFQPRESGEDAVLGRVNYLAGKWDLGLHASFSQRTDTLREEPEATAATLAFAPKFAAGTVALAPDVSLKRLREFPAGLETEEYAVNLGIVGSLLEKKLDYEVRGGFRKRWTGSAASGKDTVGAKVKAAYQPANFFKAVGSPSIGIRGEYNGISNRLYDRRDEDFSLLLSLDGGAFL